MLGIDAPRPYRTRPHGGGTSPQHPRTIGWLGTTALAMGGSNQSLFIIGALVFSQGSAAVPILILGLLLSWAAAPGWTELVLMWPNRVGGIAATCAEAFRPYSPVLATLTGVCYWWGWVPTCGLTAILSATAIHEWYLPGIPIRVMATALVLLFTAVNLCGVRWVTRLAIPIATMSAALALLSGVIPVVSGHVNWSLATTFHLTNPIGGPFGSLTSAMAGLYLVGFAAPAFEAATCHVGETVDPARNVPRAVLASGLMSLLYFVILPVIWLGALGSQPLEGALTGALGPTFAPLLGSVGRAAAIWFMMFNMFHGTLQPLAGAARTLLQLAEDGLLPRVLACRSRADVPWVATALTAGMAILFLLTGDPTWVIAAANLAYLIGIGLPSVAVWLLRRDAPAMARPYRAPRFTIGLGLVAAGVWVVATVLGFQQFGLPTVLSGLALAFSGSLLYAWRRWSDRHERANFPFWRSLHMKLTGAMLLVLALDATGYLMAVKALNEQQTARITILEDIFVAVALLTLSVGLILPGMIAHAAAEVARAAEGLASGTLADLLRAMQALGAGDIDAAYARGDATPLAVYTRDEVGAMARSFNLMQAEVIEAARALDVAREGLRQARDELRGANAELEQRVEDRTAALQQAQAAAVAHANRLDAIFHSITDGIVVSDPTGRILQTNMAARVLLGFDTAPQLLELPVSERGRYQDLRDDDGGPLPPDLWPTARILRGDVLTGAAAVDVQMTAADGRELQLNATGAPVYDQSGAISGGVTVLRDVTERQRLQRRTHDALHALLSMAETLVLAPEPPAVDLLDSPPVSPVARRLAQLTHSVLGCRRVTISAVDPATQTLQCIAAVGLTAEQERQWRERAERMSLQQLLGGEDVAARVRASEVVVVDMTQPAYHDRYADYGADTLLTAPLCAGEQVIGILTIDHGFAEHVYTSDELSLVSAAAKLVTLVLERERLLRERAEAHATELALREANGRMDEFLSIASHELRTPLTTVKGYVQLAQYRLERITGAETPDDGPFRHVAPAHEMLLRTDNHIKRLTRLIDDLLDVSRIHANRLEIRPAPCDLAAIAYDAVQEQRQIHPNRTITLTTMGPAAGAIVADADRIGQVVTNYVSNAVKYSPADHAVEVGVEAAGDVARVWVRDEGPGLADDERVHIWDRFYRVGGIEHHSGSHVGLGLGLYISRTIVERHQGEVGVDSAPGRGSTFWFTLPLLSAGESIPA